MLEDTESAFYLLEQRRNHMQTDDRMENRQVHGLAELEAKEDLQGVDTLYAVTVQLTVRVRLEAIAPRYAVEDAIEALRQVVPQAVELPHPDVDSAEVEDCFAEKIEEG